MSPEELTQVLARAKSGARSATRAIPWWREDVEQELLLCAVEVGAERFLQMSARLEGLRIICEWFGNVGSKRRAMEFHADIDIKEALGKSVPALRHEGFLAWNRLRETWGSMTPNQKAAIFCVLTDTQALEVSEETGQNVQCLSIAKRSALARVNIAPRCWRRTFANDKERKAWVAAKERERRARIKAARNEAAQ